MTARRTSTVVVVLVTALALAACSSGDDEIAADEATTTAPAREPAASETTVPSTEATEPTVPATERTVPDTEAPEPPEPPEPTESTEPTESPARSFAAPVPTTTTKATTTTRAATTSSTTSTTTTEIATTTTVPAPTRLPLTGAVLAFGQTVPGRAALVVKIDNHSSARPQTGLNLADVVFEEIVEGQITRFAAVFHSQGANPVGPIRSGRTQDVDLLSGLGAPLFVWSGGNPGVTRAIDDSEFVSVAHGANGGLFRRSGERSAPHNLFSNTDPAWETYAWAVEPPPPLFEYVLPGATVGGTPASFVDVQMGGIDVRWEYDATVDLYRRQQQGRVHELVEGPATADNVIVMITEYRPSVADRRSPEAVTVGTGLAFILTDGMMQVGVWDRPDNTAPITLNTPEGEPILIAPGRTWVELADADNHDTTHG